MLLTSTIRYIYNKLCPKHIINIIKTSINSVYPGIGIKKLSALYKVTKKTKMWDTNWNEKYAAK